MRRLLENMKRILTLTVRGSSALANQKYGEKQNKTKPKYQSVLGAHMYGKKYKDAIGRNKNVKKNTNKY